MYILAIETTGAYASVALARDDKIISKVEGHDRFSHLQNLAPQIRQTLRDAGLSIGDVDAIAVSQGPGSFTGIRIGVSTVRALSQITGIPCVPVPTLQALAMRGMQTVKAGDTKASDAKAGDAKTEAVLVCPILDARRSQVYGGGYLLEDSFPVEKIKAGAYTIEEFAELISGWDKALFIGDGADAYGEKIRQLRPAAGSDFASLYQEAEEVAHLGRKLFESGIRLSCEELKPEYMRLPEAERRLREKNGQEACGQEPITGLPEAKRRPKGRQGR